MHLRSPVFGLCFIAAIGGVVNCSSKKSDDSDPTSPAVGATVESGDDPSGSGAGPSGEGTDGGGDKDDSTSASSSKDKVAPTTRWTPIDHFGRGAKAGGIVAFSGTGRDVGSGLATVGVSIQKDGDPHACLADDLASFNAACPHYLKASGTTSWTLQTSTAIYTSGSSYQVTSRGVDVAGNVESAPATSTPRLWDSRIDVFIGVQGSAGNSYVQKLVVDTVSNAVTMGSSVDVGAYVTGSTLRALALTPTGELIGGGTGHATFTLTTALADAAGIDLTTGGSPTELNYVHGLCVLPNGHVIAGNYGAGSGVVYEFAETGAYLRSVYNAVVNSLSDCVAVSNTDVYLVDYDADNDNDGDLVKVHFDGTSWNIVERFDGSAAGFGTHSTVYSIVHHTNGHIYAPPQHLTVARNRKMLDCPSGSLAACAPVGHNITDGSLDEFLQGAAQIPGSDDLLIMTNDILYRYDLGTGNATALFDIDANFTNKSQTRHLRIAE